MTLKYDAILTVSGDGLPYEIINGFAQRPDALAAFDTVAIVPIPAGSGNGFSLNLTGAEVSLILSVSFVGNNGNGGFAAWIRSCHDDFECHQRCDGLHSVYLEPREIPSFTGAPMRMDLASVTSMETRRTVYSFLAQAAGLMAELDLG